MCVYIYNYIYVIICTKGPVAALLRVMGCQHTSTEEQWSAAMPGGRLTILKKHVEFFSM